MDAQAQQWAAYHQQQQQWGAYNYGQQVSGQNLNVKIWGGGGDFQGDGVLAKEVGEFYQMGPCV